MTIKNNTKLLLLLMSILLLFIFTGCGNKAKARKAGARGKEITKNYTSFGRQERFAKLDSAIIYLKMAENVFPDSAEVHYWLGEAISKKKWQDGKMINSDSTSSDSLHAMTLNAIKHYKRCIEIDSTYDGEIYLMPPLAKLTSEWDNLILHYMLIGNEDRAIETMKEARKMGGFDDFLLEWSKNLLKSCPKNSILFTNGEFDTWGPYYVQKIENFRTDVTILNLSLMNSSKYNLYQKSKLPIITMTKEKIENLVTRSDYDGNVFLASEQMMDHIINISREKAPDGSLFFDPPICFSKTIDPKYIRDYVSYLTLRGFVLELTADNVISDIDLGETYRLLVNEFEYNHVPKMLNIPGHSEHDLLVNNYMEIFSYTSNNFIDSGNEESAVELMQKAVKALPYDINLTGYAGNLFARKRFDNYLDSLYNKFMEYDSTTTALIGMFHQGYTLMGYNEKAISILEDAHKRIPENTDILKNLVYSLVNNGRNKQAEEILSKYLDDYSSNDELERILEQLQNGKLESSKEFM